MDSNIWLTEYADSCEKKSENLRFFTEFACSLYECPKNGFIFLKSVVNQSWLNPALVDVFFLRPRSIDVPYFGNELVGLIFIYTFRLIVNTLLIISLVDFLADEFFFTFSSCCFTFFFFFFRKQITHILLKYKQQCIRARRSRTNFFVKFQNLFKKILSKFYLQKPKSIFFKTVHYFDLFLNKIWE